MILFLLPITPPTPQIYVYSHLVVYFCAQTTNIRNKPTSRSVTKIPIYRKQETCRTQNIKIYEIAISVLLCKYAAVCCVVW